MFAQVLCVMLVLATGMRSDQHKGEELTKSSVVSHGSKKAIGEHMASAKLEDIFAVLKSNDDPMGFDYMKKQAEALADQAEKNMEAILSKAVKNGVCPKEFDFVPDGYDYGVGCGFKGVECKCPSFFDVCAKAPRFGKAEDIKNDVASMSVKTLGYCRTGAWVFILSSLLIIGALGGIGFFIYKKRSSWALNCCAPSQKRCLRESLRACYQTGESLIQFFSSFFCSCNSETFLQVHSLWLSDVEVPHLWLGPGKVLGDCCDCDGFGIFETKTSRKIKHFESFLADPDVSAGEMDVWTTLRQSWRPEQFATHCCGRSDPGWKSLTDPLGDATLQPQQMCALGLWMLGCA